MGIIRSQNTSSKVNDIKKNLAFERRPKEGESGCKRRRHGTDQVSRKGHNYTC